MDGWRDNKTFPPKKGKRTSKNQKEKKDVWGICTVIYTS